MRTAAWLRLTGVPADAARKTWRELDRHGCATLYVDGDLSLCAALAVETTTARICCFVPLGRPEHVLAGARTVQYLSAGRFTLGLRPADDDDGPFGSVTGCARLAEEVRAVLGPLPITVAGTGRGSVRLAAEFATCWQTTDVPGEPDALAAHCAEFGRPVPERSVVTTGARRCEVAADEVVLPVDRPLTGAEFLGTAGLVTGRNW
ncbi:hypothetical protein [Amycolatopsis sp. FDAARGOS 1241]|uniref:hypothetical protein n=1 Tax=Amycolatopsis sp. FDAARGOS 1241 TaxID=2778070 RepID=UPI00194F14FD|nr:hypothetical protein [Amycolatopsis sp. FDAARGOS 1241]QRP46338.1 hypothetical protein I6J71_46265 [Amycolatopsis sp. FDAARGOS 1241]